MPNAECRECEEFGIRNSEFGINEAIAELER